MRQAQINVRTRACSRTSIAKTKQAALTHNVRGKELNTELSISVGGKQHIFSSLTQYSDAIYINQARVHVSLFFRIRHKSLKNYYHLWGVLICSQSLVVTWQR